MCYIYFQKQMNFDSLKRGPAMQQTKCWCFYPEFLSPPSRFLTDAKLKMWQRSKTLLREVTLGPDWISINFH